MLSSCVGTRCKGQLKHQESTGRVVASTNGWERQAAVDPSMAALLQRKQQVGFITQYVRSIDSKACYLHVLVREVKVKTRATGRRSINGGRVLAPTNKRWGLLNSTEDQDILLVGGVRVQASIKPRSNY
jgi:hypothetical protein